MSYYVELEEDKNGDLFQMLPDEVVETLGWEDNTLLTWDIKGDGIILRSLNSETGYEQLE